MWIVKKLLKEMIFNTWFPKDEKLFYNDEKDVLELYVHKDNEYEKYDIKDKEVVNEFVKWYDDLRKALTDLI